jgi:hypothetical protein
MTSNALKSAILLDAMAAIVPDFDNASDTPQTTKKTFAIHYAYQPGHHDEPLGTGEITVLESAGQLETYRGESPTFIGALDDMRHGADTDTGEVPWMKDAILTMFDQVSTAVHTSSSVALGSSSDSRRQVPMPARWRMRMPESLPQLLLWKSFIKSGADERIGGGARTTGLFADRGVYHLSQSVDVAHDKCSLSPVDNAEVAQAKQLARHDLAF